MKFKNKKTGKEFEVSEQHGREVLMSNGAYECLDPVVIEENKPVQIDVFDTQTDKFITVEESHFDNVLSVNGRYIKKDKPEKVVKEATTPAKKKVSKKKTAKK